jgi:hypothetical protein
MLCVVAACANDPEYLPGAASIQGGTMMDAMGNLVAAKGSLALPIKPETQKDMDARTALQATLPADVVVPYVKVDDLDVSVEWTVTNLDTDNPGKFLVELNGANEAFTYDPSVIMLGAPGDEDAPPTPGLGGDIPTDIPAGGVMQGLFTEDNVLEAAVDLDQITRGAINPFAATLTVSKNIQTFQPVMTPAPTADDPDPTPVPVGDAIPRLAFRGFIRIDLVFKPDRPMQLDFNIRVRDTRGIIDDKGVGSPPAELWDMVVTCADLSNACPTVYMPAAAM